MHCHARVMVSVVIRCKANLLLRKMVLSLDAVSACLVMVAIIVRRKRNVQTHVVDMDYALLEYVHVVMATRMLIVVR